MADLRPGWRRLKFAQLADCVNDRVDDPASAGVARYVGLEHIDPESLAIRRWGTPDDVESTKLRFLPGDIIFGKRRAYQRKLAVADFEGICSAHAMVLRARPECVLPEFLPFFMQSDLFMERAQAISVGSLSPTINWKTLAAEEFALPPLEDQERAAALLVPARSVAEAHNAAAVCADQLFASTLEHLMSAGTRNQVPARTNHLVHPPTWTVRELHQLALVERGMFTHRPRNLPEFFGGPYPFVQTGDVAASTGTLAGASQRLSELGKSYSKSFPAGSILITIAAVIGATAVTTEDTWCPDSVVGIVPLSDRVNVRFLEYALRRQRPFLEFHVATQTAQKNINLQVLRPLLVAIPDREEQDNIVAALTALEGRVLALRARGSTAKALAAAVCRSLVGGP